MGRVGQPRSLALLRDEKAEQADVLQSVFLLTLSLDAVLGKTVCNHTGRDYEEYEQDGKRPTYEGI